MQKPRLKSAPFLEGQILTFGISFGRQSAVKWHWQKKCGVVLIIIYYILLIFKKINSLDYQSTRTDIKSTFLVMKAVGNHVVLTQCQTEPTQQLHSITLSRSTDTLSHEVYRCYYKYFRIIKEFLIFYNSTSQISASVRKLLIQRHLPVVSRQKLCEFPKTHSGSDSLLLINRIYLLVVVSLVFVAYF